MKLINIFFIEIFIITVCFGCVSIKANKNNSNKIEYDESEMIIFSEEIIDDIIRNRDAAFEKYRNKRFQVCSYFHSVESQGPTRRDVPPSVIRLQERIKDNIFWYSFEFNNNVKKEHEFLSKIDYFYHDDFEIRTKGVFKNNDKLIIQGTLNGYGRRRIYEQNNYREEIILEDDSGIMNYLFTFKQAKIIGIMDEEGVVHYVQ